jgi:hypothetical protein
VVDDKALVVDASDEPADLHRHAGVVLAGSLAAQALEVRPR